MENGGRIVSIGSVVASHIAFSGFADYPSGATGGPNVTYNALGLRQNHFFGPLVPAGLVRRTSEA